MGPTMVVFFRAIDQKNNGINIRKRRSKANELLTIISGL
jgi:hypothetical protein